MNNNFSHIRLHENYLLVIDSAKGLYSKDGKDVYPYIKININNKYFD